MKYALLFSGVVLFQMISFAYGNKEMFLTCAKELGISEDTLKLGPKANEGKPEFRCMGACMMKKDGSLEPGNNINDAILKINTAKHFGDKADTVYNAAIECNKQYAGIADECDFVNAADECVLSKVPDIGKYFKH